MQRAFSAVSLAVAAALAGPVVAQSINDIDRHRPVPLLGALSERTESELGVVVERYSRDRASLGRRWDVAYSPARLNRFREFYLGWADQIQALDFDGLSLEGRVDHVLMQTELRYAMESLDREERLFKEMAPLVPFAATLIDLQEARRRMEIPEPQATAALLADLPHRLTKTMAEVQAHLGSVPRGPRVSNRSSPPR